MALYRITLFSSGIFLLLLSWGSLFAEANQARVAQAFLKSPAGKYLFGETNAGRAVIEEIMGTGARDYSKFVTHLERDAQPLVQRELEHKLEQLDDLFRSSREMSSKNGKVRDLSAKLTRSDKAVLRELATRELRINPGWRALEGRAGSGKFDYMGAGRAGDLASDSFSAAKSRLFSNRPRTVFDDVEGSWMSAWDGKVIDETTAIGRVRKYFRSMRECVAQMPPAQVKKNRTRYMLTGIGMGQGMTVAGYVVGAGEKKVKWENLPSDLATDLVTSFIGTRAAMGRGTFTVKYTRMLLWKAGARTGIDAVMYTLNPIKDTYGKDFEDALQERVAFNMSFNAATAPMPIGTYALFEGLECLYPGSKMAWTSFGSRLAISSGMTYVYFKMRHAALEPPQE